ncbi:elongator complex protein 2-like isoform X2 [Xenia sp. Carnegie-2017]|nr:elongator complex protein 2-like isoform X2 [Xenia sp. Carnegie-2017]
MGHTATIINVFGLSYDYRTLFATSSADSTIKVWSRDALEEVNCIETISLDGGFAFSISLVVSSNVPILACGRENCIISLYYEHDSKFILTLNLYGHEDWIRDLNFTHLDNNDIMLASCSQDHFIRVWRISHGSDDYMKSDENKNEDNMEPLELTSSKMTIIDNGVSLSYFVVLETILSGHEGWVYSARWHPKISQNGKDHQPLCLLSSSMDKTMVIWTFDDELGVWMDDVHVGEVGGNTLGFYGGVFNPYGDVILAHSYQGSLHMWRKELESGCWQAIATKSGHFAPVQDIDWEPENGEFLVSVSTDQTTRIHAPRQRSGSEATWHEVARPQIHGYNMKCLTVISKYCFVSGADEKVIRVFQAPKSFINMFSGVCTEADENNVDNKALGATVPVLGLSNKAVFDDELKNLKSDLEDLKRPMKASVFASEEPSSFCPYLSSELPTETTLMKSTLWPETQKLYGHGYEIFCVSYDPHSKHLASACKASKAEHANIIIWDTLTWKQLCCLPGHTLTVTQMEFSHSGRFLLSVSRDRTWCLFERFDKLKTYKLSAKYDKKCKIISRVIWSCSWTPDDIFFMTASRDKQVVVWVRKSEENWTPVGSSLDAGEPVTAVAVSPNTSCYLVAIGLESGKIQMYKWSIVNGWKMMNNNSTLSHTGTVTRLKWRPSYTSNVLYLASCAADNSVKIHKILMT